MFVKICGITNHEDAEAAIEALAPCLSSDLEGVCPACGTTVKAYFDARGYCLGELRNSAAFIYQDIDLLARQYHWLEKDIIALPQSRGSPPRRIRGYARVGSHARRVVQRT